jgi:hypothetical protein
MSALTTGWNGEGNAYPWPSRLNPVLDGRAKSGRPPMKKDNAIRLLKLAETCTDTIAAAIRDVKKQAPGPGADFFESSNSPTWGSIVLGFINPVWDEHPDLLDIPESEREGEAYDPDRFNLPKEVVVEGFRALGKARGLVGEIRSLIEASELKEEEKRRFERSLAEVDGQLRQARYSVAEQHPDFRGLEPKERIPE